VNRAAFYAWSYAFQPSLTSPLPKTIAVTGQTKILLSLWKNFTAATWKHIRARDDRAHFSCLACY
jgi:hypothetical protein